MKVTEEVWEHHTWCSTRSRQHKIALKNIKLSFGYFMSFIAEISHVPWLHYHPRMRISNNFSWVCLSVCLPVWAITFEPLWLGISFSVYRYFLTISMSSLSIIKLKKNGPKFSRFHLFLGKIVIVIVHWVKSYLPPEVNTEIWIRPWYMQCLSKTKGYMQRERMHNLIPWQKKSKLSTFSGKYSIPMSMFYWITNSHILENIVK